MEFVLILFVVSGGAYSQKLPLSTSPRIKAGNSYVDIGEKYISEMKCIEKLQKVVEARLIEELNNVPINDADNLTKIPWEERESNFTKYNTYEDEWLMKDGLPLKKIEQCVRHVLSDVVKTSDNKLNKNDVDCINKIASDHALYEYYHQRDFGNLINSTSNEQLPFRKFISFPQIVDLIFQNRQLSDWTSIEALLYVHTKSYVLSDADESRENWIATQNCDWVRLKALKDTRNELELLREFKSQVLEAVDEKLAATLIRNWNMNEVLPKERYSLWLKSRQDMMIQLEREIKILRNQPKDSITICKYAEEIAANFTDVQSAILINDDDSLVANFIAFDSTPDIRIIEKELAAVDDSRYLIVKKIADRQEYEMRCLSSFYRLVENHRRYEIAMEFIDGEYEFAEIYCKKNKKNPGVIQFIFCNCIGTICVAHDLAALFEEEYVLVKGSDGVYKIVRSGIKSKRKVTHCHTLANTSRN